MIEKDNHLPAAKSQHSETLLRNTIDSSFDMIQVFRAVRNDLHEIVDFEWILNNKAAEKNFGNVIGKSLLALNPGVIKEGIFQTFKEVVETGIPDQKELYYAHEQFDGWFHQSTVKQGDGVTTTTRDITASKMAEQAIRQSEAFLQALIDASLDIIQVFEAVRDEQNRIIDFKWRIQNVNGKRQNGDVIGKSLLACNPGVVSTGIYQRMVEVTETGIPSVQEQYYSHEQFDDAWFYQALAKHDDGVMMTTRDITPQKKAELEVLRLKDELAQRMQDKYLSIFNSIGEGFCIFELLYNEKGEAIDFQFIEVNPAFEQLTGLNAVIGKTVNTLSPGFESHWLDVFHKVLQTGEPVRFETFSQRSQKWYHVYASRVGVFGSHYIAAIFDDITDRKRQSAQQALLADIGKDLVEMKNIIHTMKVLGEKIARHFEVPCCRLEEVSGKIKTAMSISGWNDPESPVQWKTSSLLQLLSPAHQAALNRAQPIVYSESDSDSGESTTAMLASGVHAFIAVPLCHNAELRFILTILDTRSRNWRQDETELLKELGSRIWTWLDRSRSEEAFHDTEKKYAAAFNSMEQGFCLLELLYNDQKEVEDLVFLEVNPAFEINTGLKDVIGKKVNALLPTFEQYWLDAFTKVAQTGESFQMENYVKDLDRWHSVYFSQIGDADAKQVAVLFSDITKRKQQELRQEFLLQLSDQLHPLTDAADIQEIAARRLGQQLQATRAFYFETEKQGDDYCHIVVRDYYAHPDMPSLKGVHRYHNYLHSIYAPLVRGETLVIKDINSLVRENPELAERYQQLEIRSLVYVPLIKNGQYVAAFAVNDNSVRNWSADEIALVLETAHRTWAAVERAIAETALRLSESLLNGQKEAFQAAVNGRSLAASLAPLAQTMEHETSGNARAAFYVIPPGGDGLRLLAGMTVEYTSNTNDFKVVPESPACRNARYSGEPVITENAEQDPIWEEWLDIARIQKFKCCWSFPISTYGGPVLGTFAMYFTTARLPQPKEMQLAEMISHAAAIIISRYTELAERTLAEVSLRNSERQLKELVRIREEFINVASHELKTPVTSIRAYAEIVQERLSEHGDVEGSNMIRQLNAQINRLTTLINHLLDTSSISEGRMKLIYEELDLNDLLTERLEEISRTSDHIIDLQTAELKPVVCDRERIGQVLTNLISNAIKYSKPGTRIIVKSEAFKNEVKISVKDEGYGIPAADLRNIFQRFFRVRAHSMDTFPGMGLGLYISSQIIESHNGNISVESYHGAGSTFSFVIPYDTRRTM